MRRLVLTALLLPLLSGCVSLAAITAARLPATPAATTRPAITPAPTVAGDASPGPSAMPTSPPLVAQAAPPPAARMLSGTFAIVAIGQGGVSGVVHVSQTGTRFVATVSVHGLPTGMTALHAVHIHLGSCANPYGGTHLTILGILGADAGGAGSFSAPLAGTYVASGRYVIVYASLAPRVIVGCANLAALS